MPAPVTSKDFSEVGWRGHWIWVPEEPITPGSPLAFGSHGYAKEAHGLFRRKVNLERVPERAPSRITADSRYALFANGQEVFRGPIRSQPRRLYYDLFDLAPYLRPGENILAAYVKYYGTPKSYWMPAAPNMTLGKTGILVLEANLGDAGWLVSDGTWKAHKADAWSDDWREGAGSEPEVSGVPIEVFDARRYPYGWREAGFDDRDWGRAQVVPAMHIGGFARTRPPPTLTGRSTPARLPGWAARCARLRSCASRPCRAKSTRQSVAPSSASRRPSRCPSLGPPRARHCPSPSMCRLVVRCG